MSWKSLDILNVQKINKPNDKRTKTIIKTYLKYWRTTQHIRKETCVPGLLVKQQRLSSGVEAFKGRSLQNKRLACQFSIGYISESERSLFQNIVIPPSRTSFGVLEDPDYSILITLTSHSFALIFGLIVTDAYGNGMEIEEKKNEYGIQWVNKRGGRSEQL